MQAESLAEVFDSSGNGSEAIDDIYFPTVAELIQYLLCGKTSRH